MSDTTRTGGEHVCAALQAAGCDVIFSVSGNQILPIFDAAPDAGIRIIHMRHESAAAYAAAAYAEISGRIGVALTSAGPGFLAGLQGVAAAATMELPLLYLSGDAAVSQRGRGAFQEIDQIAIAQVVCKSSCSVDRPGEIPGVFRQAARRSMTGVPGPVHISLPGDVLAASAPADDDDAELESSSKLTSEQESVVATMAARLGAAKKPLILARPSATRGEAAVQLQAVARSLGIQPVAIEAPRGLADLKYASISARFPESDCVLVLAAPDFALGFLARDRIAEDGAILLVDAEGDPPSNRTPDLHLRADMMPALEALRKRLGTDSATDPDWSALWPLPEPPRSGKSETGKVHPLAVSEAVRELIGPDDIVVLDGGEFCQWVRLGLRDLANPVLWNGKIGAIGGGVPMAVGAAVAAAGTGRRVISIMGDGAAGYHLSEFETMDRYSLPVTAIIGNDARWAAEWHLQIARYGEDRTFETELTPARYDQVAAGFEAFGDYITEAGDLPGALQEALDRTKASCINVAIAALPSPAAMS
ncbi:MAG: thiamine pyrophosphate-binding protein [Thermomicrobiales bacterium]